MCDNYFDDIGLTLSQILGPEKAKRLAIYDRKPVITDEAKVLRDSYEGIRIREDY